jgi:hypothetical protein
MLRHRISALVALMAFSATTLALAQTTPPANSSTSPTTSPSSPKPNGDENNSAPDTQGAPAASADKSAQDPKMKACMKAEKAKNSGLDDNQLKQKCVHRGFAAPERARDIVTRITFSP